MTTAGGAGLTVGHMSAQPFPPAQTTRKDEADSMLIALGGIWAAVAAISIFSPDMVSGSEQQHMPVAAFATWIWGAVATYGMTRYWVAARRNPTGGQLHRQLSVAVAALWLVAAAVSVFGPVMVTGSDPTRIPFGAMFAPVVATVLTFLARSTAELLD